MAHAPASQRPFRFTAILYRITPSPLSFPPTLAPPLLQPQLLMLWRRTWMSGWKAITLVKTPRATSSTTPSPKVSSGGFSPIATATPPPLSSQLSPSAASASSSRTFALSESLTKPRTVLIRRCVGTCTFLAWLSCRERQNTSLLASFLTLLAVLRGTPKEMVQR